MSLKLIREAQIRSTLPKSLIERYTKLGEALGIPMIEAAEMFSSTVEPEDYQEWLRLIDELSQENGYDLTKKSVFNDLAFDVLDNDPKMELIGNNEDTKVKIVNALWHAYNVNAAHTAVGDHLNNPPSEENEELTGQSTPDLDLMSTIHSSVELQKVYRSGVLAGQNDAGKPDNEVTKSKYQRGTTRDKVWKLGHKHGCVGGCDDN